MNQDARLGAAMSDRGRAKYPSRESRAAIREVLMCEWDTIGVRGIRAAADEYDLYLAKLYVMLMQEHATAKDVAAYLVAATDRMGLALDPELTKRGERAAATLAALRPYLEIH